MATQPEDYDIVGSFNNQRVLNIDAERSVNLFEYLDPNGKKPKTLLPTSGIASANVTFPDVDQTHGFRGSFFYNNDTYHVIGNRVYQVSGLGIAIHINPSELLLTTTGYIGISANASQIIFVDGLNGYIYTPSAALFARITNASFPDAPIDVDFLDGFFIVGNANTNQFYLSSLNDGLIWNSVATTFPQAGTSVAADTITPASMDGLDTGVPITFSTAGTLPNPLAAGTTYYVIRNSSTNIKVATTLANAFAGVAIDLTTQGDAAVKNIAVAGQLQQGAITSHPGTIVALRVLHRRLFIFSQFFTEVWENAGLGTTLPFRRNNALLMEYGCAAIGSVSVGFDRMFFLSQDRDGLSSLMMVMGTEAMPVSTRALDFIFAQYANDATFVGVSDARGFLIKENGLIFYRLNFTRADHTYVYNVSMSDAQNQRWHEEEMLDGTRHVAQTHVYFGGNGPGKNYYGHYALPILYDVSPEYVTNNGETIKRMRIGRPICPATYQRMRIDRFQLDLVQGSVDIQGGGELDTVTPILTETTGLELLTEVDNYLMTESSLPGDSDVDTPTPDPVVYLSYSKDGGQTYGSKIQAPMGKIGERTFRTVWRKLGTTPRGQGFVPKLEFYGQIPFIILGAAWCKEVMPE